MSNAENPNSPEHSTPSFEVGQKLADVYVLRRELASGIWLAHDEVLGKDVSLHFIPQMVLADERSLTELRQEIKRNRQLIHPGILRVYDLVEEPDWSAISMDWFEGESLATLQKSRSGGFFEPSDIKPWMQQVCQTLEDIHKIQIVHKAISTNHIFVDGKGRVLVAKFGIGRVIEDALARLAPKDPLSNARLASMSPQLLDGETPNKVDDVYSVGALIYELLTGELPFTGVELLPQIRKSPPMPMMERRLKLGKRGGTILPVWEKWVAAALAKSREDRPQNAGELAAKLGLTGRLTSEAVLPGAAPAAAAEAVTKDAPPGAAPARTAEKPAETPPKRATPEPGAIAAIAVATTAAGAETAVPKAPEVSAPIKAAQPDAPNHSPAEEPERVGPPPAPSRQRDTRYTPDENEVAVKSGGADDEDAGEYKDFARQPSNTWPAVLIFAALIAVVGLAIFFMNKPGGDGGDSATSTPVPRDMNGSTPAPTGELAANTDANSNTEGGNSPGDSTGGSDGVGILGEPNLIATSGDGPGENLLAANTAKSGKSGGNASGSSNDPGDAPPDVTPTNATPPETHGNPSSIAPPIDETPANKEPAGAAGGGDPEKAYAAAVTQKKSAEAAVAEAERALQKKSKSTESVVKAAEPLIAQRTKRAEQVKSSEESAAEAQKAAEEKAKAAAEAKKALTDWESANAKKLAPRDKAVADLEALKSALAEKKQQVEAAAKAIAVADAERQQSVAARRAQEAAEKESLPSKQATGEAGRKAAEERSQQQKKIDEEIERMQERLKELQRMREGDAGAASTTPPATGSTSSSPAGEASSSPDDPRNSQPLPRSSPAATPGSGPPAPPPPSPHSPQPVRTVQAEFLGSPLPLASVTPPSASPLATPAADTLAPAAETATPPALAMLTSTPRVLPSTPAPSATPAKAETPDGNAPGAAEGENSLGMKFAPVGDVLFCIWPVRLRDFDVFAKESGFRPNAWRVPGFKQGPDHPVVNVSWNDATAFCRWLTAREHKRGVLAKGQEYRLPTDVEWSCAVGLPKEEGRTPDERDLGVPDVFPWGTAWPPPPKAGNYTGEETSSEKAIKGYDDGFPWTSPVGSFPPNKLGLYDVGGNVWQWCMDSLNSESKERVLRGGSWYNGALEQSLLSSRRLPANPDSSTDNYGFRVVKTGDAAQGARVSR